MKLHPWLNWIEHRPPKAGTARSNRAGCARIKKPMTLVVGVFILYAFDDTNAQQSVRTAAKRWTCTPIVCQHNFARSAKPIRHGCAMNSPCGCFYLCNLLIFILVFIPMVWVQYIQYNRKEIDICSDLLSQQYC